MSRQGPRAWVAATQIATGAVLVLVSDELGAGRLSTWVPVAGAVATAYGLGVGVLYIARHSRRAAPPPAGDGNDAATDQHTDLPIGGPNGQLWELALRQGERRRRCRQAAAEQPKPPTQIAPKHR